MKRSASQVKMVQLLIIDVPVIEISDLPRVEVVIAHELFSTVIQLMYSGLFPNAIGMELHEVLFQRLLVVSHLLKYFPCLSGGFRALQNSCMFYVEAYQL